MGMGMMRSRSFLLGCFLALSLCAGNAAAQGYKAEALSEAPPQELASPVREALSASGIRVTGPGGPVCDIWLRKAVPAKANAGQSLGVIYPQLAQGTLVAAIRLPNATKDYRKQLVKPGTYTLRYALLPDNGNHMGVAPQRDFLLASPAATGSNHPSVWSLGPAEDHPKSLPAAFHQDDGDLWHIEFRLPLQDGTPGPSPISMALVVVGSAPEA